MSGFAYDFEVFTGQENQPDKILPCEPDLGASSSFAVWLSRKVKKKVLYKFYVDNYFTSMKLIA